VIKAEFIIITPVFRVTWSSRNHDLMLKKQLWLSSVLKTVYYIFISRFV